MAAGLTVPTADLTGETIASTYDQLLILDSTAGMVNTTLKIVSTQTGRSALQITNDQVLIKDASTEDIASCFEVQDKDGTICLSVNGTNNRVGIGTAAPGEMLTIESTADTAINITDSGATSHGMTNIITDGYTCGRLAQIHTSNLGFLVMGASSHADQFGLVLAGYIGVADPTDSVPAIRIEAGKKDGVDGQVLAADETMLQIVNYTDVALTMLGNGYVGIGTVSPGYPLHVKVLDGSEDTFCAEFENIDASNPEGIWIRFTGGNYTDAAITGDKAILCSDSDSDNFMVFSDGGVVADEGEVHSDVRLKENIIDATPKLDDLNKLKVRNFNFKPKDAVEGKRIGFIADELETIFPSMIRKRAINKFGVEYTDLKHIKYEPIVAMLVKAVQELSAKVEALENV